MRSTFNVQEICSSWCRLCQVHILYVMMCLVNLLSSLQVIGLFRVPWPPSSFPHFQIFIKHFLFIFLSQGERLRAREKKSAKSQRYKIFIGEILSMNKQRRQIIIPVSLVPSATGTGFLIFGSQDLPCHIPLGYYLLVDIFLLFHPSVK